MITSFPSSWLNLLKGQPLPAFRAGAHIDVHLSPDLILQYSLLTCSSERNRYVMGVLNDPLSRGGSRLIHQQWYEGQNIVISEPRNLFAITPETQKAILFAGGIGITPILGQKNFTIGLLIFSYFTLLKHVVL